MFLSPIVYCHSLSVVCGGKMSQIMATIDLKTLLGVSIKIQRTSLGISQEELGHRAGLHRTYISDLERGARNPSIESIEKLAGALQVSVANLFESLGHGGGSQQMVKILLVADNPRDADLTKSSFAQAKITNPIHVVRDGAEALDFLLATGAYSARRGDPHPQVVLLDLNLQNVSGLEVLRQLKADKRTRDIPVVVLTASTRDRDIAECRRLGAANYIVKPVNFHNFSEIAPRLSLAWMLVQKMGEALG
jgi:CheY-like chemotaxis protein/DNA-binding XRE family transcriptional regulator